MSTSWHSLDRGKACDSLGDSTPRFWPFFVEFQLSLRYIYYISCIIPNINTLECNYIFQVWVFAEIRLDRFPIYIQNIISFAWKGFKRRLLHWEIVISEKFIRNIPIIRLWLQITSAQYAFDLQIECSVWMGISSIIKLGLE